jgi:hypothetical protein
MLRSLREVLEEKLESKAHEACQGFSRRVFSIIQGEDGDMAKGVLDKFSGDRWMMFWNKDDKQRESKMAMLQQIADKEGEVAYDIRNQVKWEQIEDNRVRVAIHLDVMYAFNRFNEMIGRVKI